ncbi:hypothetical protein BH18ACT5_BH18ACT5_07430 [soil metagenome]
MNLNPSGRRVDSFSVKARHLRKRPHSHPVVALLLLALVAVPLVGQAASRFVDVTSDNPLAADIEWLHAWGITKGCSPTHLCPTDWPGRRPRPPG